MVGSRKADDVDLRLAEDMGRQAAVQGRTVVSGGAKGIDQRAMLGALDREGTAVGVLADSLLRSATSAKYRKYLVSNDLALVTPFNPEARFHVGSAMSRNKYIYCLADAAVAVSSTRERGGTWNGAVENLKAGWVSLWVKRNDSPASGNSELVRRGARWLPPCAGPDDLLAASAGTEVGERTGPPTAEVEDSADRRSAVTLNTPDPAGGARNPDEHCPGLGCTDFYRLFLEWMDGATDSEPIDADDIARRLDLKKTQVAAWLKRGMEEQRLRKLAKPVRYQSMRVQGRQPSLLRDKR